MAGASSSWESGSSTGGLWDYIKTKASDIWTFDKKILGTVANVSPVQVVGPILALPTSMSKAATVVNKAGGFTNGIQLSQSPWAWLDTFGQSTDFLDMTTATPDPVSASNPLTTTATGATGSSNAGFLDVLKAWANKPASTSTDMPLWAKTAIIGAVVVGSAVVLKGVMK